MLEAEPMNWRRSAYAVRDGGAPVTELSFATFRERGEFTLDGVTYTLRRQAGGEFALQDPNGVTVARATRPSAFRRRFELDHPGGRLRLEPASSWRPSYRILGAEGEVGTVYRRSMWRGRVTADLPADLSRPVQVFALWMVLLMFRRAEAAASAGAGTY